MKVYISLFRIRFINGLQYRIAAVAGLATQFAWGFMEILAFLAFYRARPDAFPMEISHLVSYIWIQQAFLTLLMPWVGVSDAVESVVSGNIVYDLARPLGIYIRWFIEIVAGRVSKAVLRCIPVLLIAFLLPYPFKMVLPPSVITLLFFFLSLILGLSVVTAFCVLDYTSSFYTMSRFNAISMIAADFFAGGYIPLPFFPEKLRRILELSPFAAMQNIPLRIYSGSITGVDAIKSILLQVFWLAFLIITGRMLMNAALKRLVTQGG